MGATDNARNKLKDVRQFIRDAGDTVGVIAVNHFKNNFIKSGFDNKKWEESKRRDPSSDWYGFKAGVGTRLPNNHPRRRGSKKRYRNRGGITNYSVAATKRRTLTGTGSLRDSINYKVRGLVVTVYSGLPYSKIHNEGGFVKVFGRGRARMPKRQFIGDSMELRSKIVRKLTASLRKIRK